MATTSNHSASPRSLIRNDLRQSRRVSLNPGEPFSGGLGKKGRAIIDVGALSLPIPSEWIHDGTFSHLTLSPGRGEGRMRT